MMHHIVKFRHQILKYPENLTYGSTGLLGAAVFFQCIAELCIISARAGLIQGLSANLDTRKQDVFRRHTHPFVQLRLL